MKQNSMLAMILAGGRGSRLHELTNKVAKPAVGYGGKYRIVDFPLSNCANSGIDVVGVLTQYESVLLNSYVAAGGRWGLDAKDSGVYVLPPREKADAGLDVRTMAKELKISALTVKKAYDNLEAEGMTVTVHGKGTYVAASNTQLMEEERRKEVEADLEAAIQKGRRCGMKEEEIRSLFELIMEDE